MMVVSLRITSGQMVLNDNYYITWLKMMPLKKKVQLLPSLANDLPRRTDTVTAISPFSGRRDRYSANGFYVCLGG